MDKVLNEDIFDFLLEKAFVRYEKDLQKTYPDIAELEKEYPASRRKIRKYINILKEKQYGKKIIWIYAGRAAVVLLCMFSLLFGLIMTNSEARASVETVMLKWYDKYTEFIFNEVPADFSSYELADFEMGYIPEGFELLYDDVFSDIRDTCYMNTKNSDMMLDIQIFDSAQTSVFVDNEKMLFEKMKIGSNDAWIMYNDAEGYSSLLIADTKYSILVVGDLSKEEIIKVAKNIR